MVESLLYVIMMETPKEHIKFGKIGGDIFKIWKIIDINMKKM